MQLIGNALAPAAKPISREICTIGKSLISISRRWSASVSFPLIATTRSIQLVAHVLDKMPAIRSCIVRAQNVSRRLRRLLRRVRFAPQAVRPETPGINQLLLIAKRNQPAVSSMIDDLRQAITCGCQHRRANGHCFTATNPNGSRRSDDEKIESAHDLRHILTSAQHPYAVRNPQTRSSCTKQFFVFTITIENGCAGDHQMARGTLRDSFSKASSNSICPLRGVNWPTIPIAKSSFSSDSLFRFLLDRGQLWKSFSDRSHSELP